MFNDQLQKKTPLDIFEYMDRRRGFFITSHEIGEVFKIDDNEAEERLRALTSEGVLQDTAITDAGSYWQFPIGLDVPKLTLKQVELSHVTAKSRVSEKDDLGKIVTKSIKKLYTEVAEDPRKGFHFPLGREAAIYVGYLKEELDKIPKAAVESFAGVGYPFASKVIKQGDSVLDIGSGSGTDVLVAALKVGANGKVFGIDFTDAMITKAEKNIAESGFKNVKIIRGNAGSIPLPDGSIDVVTSNGVLNLVPDKNKAFQDILRVLKPGGSLQLADIVVQKDVQKTCGLVPQLWADCIGGAAVQSSYLQMIKDAGFIDVKEINKMDYFSKSNSDSTKRLTKTFGAESIVISAKKPA
jgi:ubiquinone/menaquinone biosynthesis C-methylase UbiE